MVFGKGEDKDYGGQEDDGMWVIWLLAVMLGCPFIGGLIFILSEIIGAIM